MRATDPSLYNDDLAPIPLSRRTWGTYNYASLWVAMSVCIPTYMLASGLIAGGMSWWQAIATILLGNLIVLVPMLLNAHAGAKYGIPFPVFVRASFGVKGANVPAVLRALVACGWFGIQTWIFSSYIFGWLVGYSGLVGPIAGVMIADYFLLRRSRLRVADLYRRRGTYEYDNGVNWRAIAALVSGVVAALLGLAVPALRLLYDYAWFVGFGVAGAVYLALMRGAAEAANTTPETASETA
ncbi:MAG: cytosine permease [Bryobacteraceae bacterium]|jgi:cytosine/uracil/thiamine/allantoin permease